MKLFSHVMLALARHLPRGYWRIVRFAACKDPALWDVPLPLRRPHGEFLRADLREPVFTPVLRYGCFPHQVGEDLLCLSVLRAGDRVFDVGANIGYPTLLFSHAVGPGGTVVALEPSPRAFPLLQRSTGGRANVTCRSVAASDHAGIVRFYETASLDTSSLESIAGVAPKRVQAMTLDALAAEHGVPTLVKIDVEGHEPAVFRGMKRLLRQDRRPMLLFEALTDAALNAATREINQLASNGYAIYRCSTQGTLLSLRDPEGTNNYFALPEWGRDRVGPSLLPTG